MRSRTAEPPLASTLRTLYPRVRAATEALAAPLRVEDMVVQSMPDASPTKWHLAHTSWFFETFVLRPSDGEYRTFDERWAVLFNSYYHAAGERHPRPERGMLSRPTVEEVRAYRRHVDLGMERLLARADLADELLFLVELGLNHEEQHQELLLTDVKHVLALNPLEPAYRAAENGREWLRPAAPRRRSTGPVWSAFAGGLIEIGNDAPGFAFDNERPRHKRWCEPFELARAPVTCGEYLEFVEADGYRRSELWLSDGFDAVERLGWEAPLHWRRAADGWRVFTLDGARPLDPAEPVCHVSLYEADAYARFRGARLPSEEEWEHAAAGERVAGNLLESGRLHPAPAAEAGERLEQAFGDVWEWTSSAYAPYPGFAPFAGAIGEYNGKWMSSRNVLRGGSCATPARHARATYRNFFGPEARWQFTGIRLARSPGS
jgi:ergothioneine biosynthesis protein EgtB